MFYSAGDFNQNIGAWNTGAVTNMSQMFGTAPDFNNGGSGDINNWNTSAVTNMQGMFQSATAFNQNIGAWNLGSVTNIHAIIQKRYSI
jgi:surface protein